MTYLPEPLDASRILPYVGREMAGEYDVEVLHQHPAEDSHPSRILRHKSKPWMQVGDLWDEMLRHPALRGLYNRLFDEVLQLPRWIEAGDATPAAEAAKNLAKDSLAEIDHLDTVYRHLLGARPRGVAVVERIWERLPRGKWQGALTLVDLKDRPLRRFTFHRGDLQIRRQAGQRGPGEPAGPLPFAVVAPAGKFVVSTHGTKDSPWGDAECDAHYYPLWYYQHGEVFWAHAVESWADPKTWIEYKRRGTAGGNADREEQAKAIALAREIRDSSAFAVPEGMTPKLWEAMRNGNVSYEGFLRHWLQMMYLTAAGEFQTAGLRSGAGAYKSEEVAITHFVSRVKSLAHALCAVVSDQLLRDLTTLNFGPDVAAPRMVISASAADDRRLQVEGLKLAREWDVVAPKHHVYEVLGFREPRPGEPVHAWPGSSDFPVGDSPAPTADDPMPSDPAPPTDPDDDAARLTRRSAALLLDRSRSEDAEQRELDAVVAALRVPALDRLSRIRTAILETWDGGGFERGQGLDAVVAAFDAPRWADTLLAAKLHGAGVAFEGLRDAGLPPGRWRIAAGGADERLDPPLTRDDARIALTRDYGRHTTSDAVIAWWTDRLAVVRSLFDGLADLYRRLVFTMAGVDDVRLLRDIHEVVADALADGLDRRAFRQRVDELFAARGLDSARPWHLDLVLGNSVRQAHGATRYRQVVLNPAGRRAFPYLRWRTIGDDKVRERPRHDHDVMEGRIFASGHPIWRTWWYPAGHGCRCLVELISRPAARRLGLVGDEPSGPWPVDRWGPQDRQAGRGPALPDPGFRVAPGPADLDALAEDLEEALGRELDQASAEQGAAAEGPDLLGALGWLLAALGLDALLPGRLERTR